jgi:hypothetical protein
MWLVNAGTYSGDSLLLLEHSWHRKPSKTDMDS